MSKSYMDYHSFCKTVDEYPECKQIKLMNNYDDRIVKKYVEYLLLNILPKILDITICDNHEDLTTLSIGVCGLSWYVTCFPIESDINVSFSSIEKIFQAYLDFRLPFDWKIINMKHEINTIYVHIYSQKYS